MPAYGQRPDPSAPTVAATEQQPSDYINVGGADNPTNFGAGIGQEEEKAGAQAQQVGQQTMATATEMANRQLVAATLNTASQATQEISQRAAKFYQLQGNNAQSGLQPFRDDLMAIQAKYSGMFPQGGDGQMRVLQEIKPFIDRTMLTAGTHAGEQIKQAYTASLQSGAASDQDAAIQTLVAGGGKVDVDFAPMVLKTQRLLEEQGRATDANGNQIDTTEEINRAVGKTVMTAGKQLIDSQNVSGAQTLLDKYGDQMDPGSKTMLMGALKTTQGVAERQAIAQGAVSVFTSGMTGASALSPNNLGNIRADASSFRTYQSPQEGAADAANLLRSNYRNLTIQQIGAKWAPAGDHNNPDQWANNVANAAGMKPGDTPNLDDPAQVQRLVQGIATAEQSKVNIGRFTPDVIQAGVTDAFSGRVPSHGTTSAPIAPLPGAAPAPPNHAQQLLAAGEAPMELAYNHYLEANPGNVAGAVATRDAARQNVERILSDQRMKDTADMQAYDAALNGSVGGKAVGAPPTTLAALRAMPGIGDVVDRLAASGKLNLEQVNQHLTANAKGADVQPNQDNQSQYYKLMGTAANDREAFAGLNMMDYYGKMPAHQWQQLVNMQTEMGKKDAAVMDRTQLLNNAMGNKGVQLIFERSHLFPPKTGVAPSDDYAEATGRLTSALSNWKQANPGKAAPGDDELAKMAADITQKVKVPGTLWGTNDKPLYQVNPTTRENKSPMTPVSGYTYNIPQDFVPAAQAELKRVGKPASDANIQALYHAHLSREGVVR